MAVGLIASLAVGAAWAQGTTLQSQATPQAQPPPQAGPPGRRPGDGMNDIAKLLGMTPDEIWAERVQGKTSLISPAKRAWTPKSGSTRSRRAKRRCLIRR